MNEIDIRYMRRCLQLADGGLGSTYPNPLVGAVVVHNGAIIGEGFHQRYGERHAEANAIAAIQRKELLAYSTLYVGLEPCCHQGKQPPCTDLIIQHRIPHVVIATTDPFPSVCGMGIARLKGAGVKVEVGILENEAKWQNRRFNTFHLLQRPYVILKWAQSADGYMDSNRTPLEPAPWLTGSTGKLLVHRWRTEEQAIMVGANTVLRDNPQLTARSWRGSNPLRVVYDRELTLPADAALFDAAAPTLVFTHAIPTGGYAPNVEVVTIGTEDVEQQQLAELYKRGIQSVMVEGGGKLLNSFISKGLWDEARIFTGYQKLNGGVKAPIHPSGQQMGYWSNRSFELRILRNEG